MSSLQIVTLNPATPQIRVPGVGDTYSFPQNLYSTGIFDFAGLTGDPQFTLQASGLLFQQSSGVSVNRLSRSVFFNGLYLSVDDGTGVSLNNGIEAGIFRLRDTRTVAQLPNGGIFAKQGAMCVVSNATLSLAAGVGTIVAGGGANKVPVYFDGAAWRIG